MLTREGEAVRQRGRREKLLRTVVDAAFVAEDQGGQNRPALREEALGHACRCGVESAHESLPEPFAKPCGCRGLTEDGRRAFFPTGPERPENAAGSPAGRVVGKILV